MANPASELEALQASTDRRAHPRYPVDCAVVVTRLYGASPLQGRLMDLSLGGCRISTSDRQFVGILTRVEVQFQLRGIAFRLIGTTAGTRSGTSFAIRFLDMPKRRLDELAEVIAELAAKEAAAVASRNAPEPGALPPQSVVETRLEQSKSTATVMEFKPVAVDDGERRRHSRHEVDTRAVLFLVKSSISMAGSILNLSHSGCRLRTDQSFSLGIYVRVETEFYLHGLPFRIAGVSQAILNRNTIGVRFLDMSERRREQLAELIAEITAAESDGGQGL